MNKNILNLLIVAIISAILGYNFSKILNEKHTNAIKNMNHENVSVHTNDDTEKIHSHNSAHLHVKANFPEPKITLEAFKDTMGGYNIKVKTENFKWSPEKAGLNVDSFTAPEGHAHVYVNNKKVGRLYGEWMYLKADHFSKGENEILVTLNGNNHMDWYSADDLRQMKAAIKVIVE